MIIQERIDFLFVIVAEKCNPNGDPLNRNCPRQDIDGYGEISDVCLKRKLRNRMQEMGHEILLKDNARSDDGCQSTLGRIKKNKRMQKAIADGDIRAITEISCETWMDVRFFGQVFPIKKSSGVTSFVRGPVSISFAKSLDYIFINEYVITKSLNHSDTEKGERDSTTISKGKSMIDKGVYIARGSIFPELAKKTGFSYEDAETLKECILTMFENDVSAARPSGSMSIDRLYWWRKKTEEQNYPPIKIFRTLDFHPTKEYPYYEVTETPLDGLRPEMYM